MKAATELEFRHDVRRVTEYLFPRWIDLIAQGWLAASRELQSERVGEIVGPLVGLASRRTILEATRYVMVLATLYGADGNVSLAARSFSVHRKTLIRTLKAMHRAGIDFSPALIEDLYARRYRAEL